MDYYFVLKWVHIMSATVLFGTGLGSAFYMFAANRTNNIAYIAFAARFVVIADWAFTTPAVLIQFFTGFGLIYVTGYKGTEFWILASLLLYFFAGFCWLPVVFMQIKMRDMAQAALKSGAPLPEDYWRMDRWWIGLGSLAFPAVVLVFWLMVVRSD